MGIESPVASRLAVGVPTVALVDSTHRTAIERLARAGAVPNTSLAIVTELFRDWKSPVAAKAREILKAYQADLQKLQ